MSEADSRAHAAVKFAATLLFIAGIPLSLGGLWLMFLGGSWYYLIAGICYTYAGYRLWNGRLLGVHVLLGVLLVTLIWSIWEVGFSFWPSVPRLVAPIFVGAVTLSVVRYLGWDERPASTMPYTIGGAVLAVAFIAFFAGMFNPHDIVRNSFKVVPGNITGPTQAMGGDWLAYGRTGEGTRYAPLDQITRANVGGLEKVWEIHHGEVADDKLGKEDQNTPIFAAGKLVYCSPSSQVTAIEPATGKKLWHFDPKVDPKATSAHWKRCRSVGFVPTREGDGGDCGNRIVVATADRRMIALRAADGKLCETFGKSGTVDLGQGLGHVDPGIVMPTTGPNIAGDKIVIGAWVADNVSMGEPSGVIRAYDAYTGALAWAWDLGNPETTKLPPEGEVYTLGTPNVWPPMAWDLDLGLVYLPMGNATPDYYGAKRRPFDDKYSSAVVALDLKTGRPKWHFQTVHHDLWDFDLPSQPALVDMPDGKGGTIPALIQLTKRGHIFVLDRRTGNPITEVKEMPVPKDDGTATGEYYSPTQPHSVGMPVISADLLSERRMWGATPIDQMLCRIKFRQHRYDGDFTTQSTKPTIQWPGNAGGLNWGSTAIDQERNIMVVNDMRMPMHTQLVARKDIPPGTEYLPHGGWAEQRGTPFAFHMGYFLSPLGFPCVSPPMGMITAIDLASRKIAWQIPGGTMGDALGIPFYVGMPTVGGPMVTKGGIAFYAGTQDYYLRAIDVETGAILWKGRLPVGAQATPMTFLDKKSGRQYVVVTAGGARGNSKDRGGYIVAFALPKK